MYFPRWQKAPDWVASLVGLFARHQGSVDSHVVHNTSDQILAILRKDLEALGYRVEQDKTQEGKLYRPVFFRDNGQTELQYEIDAYHPELKVGLEIEAGRAVQGNAIYRDIIQMSLIIDMDYAAVAAPLNYVYNQGSKKVATNAYARCRSILEAIYGGPRLQLPFVGFLLIGY